jgi:hypothetical protein
MSTAHNVYCRQCLLRTTSTARNVFYTQYLLHATSTAWNVYCTQRPLCTTSTPHNVRNDFCAQCLLHEMSTAWSVYCAQCLLHAMSTARNVYCMKCLLRAASTAQWRPFSWNCARSLDLSHKTTALSNREATGDEFELWVKRYQALNWANIWISTIPRMVMFEIPVPEFFYECRGNKAVIHGIL